MCLLGVVQFCLVHFQLMRNVCLCAVRTFHLIFKDVSFKSVSWPSNPCKARLATVTVKLYSGKVSFLSVFKYTGNFCVLLLLVVFSTSEQSPCSIFDLLEVAIKAEVVSLVLTSEGTRKIYFALSREICSSGTLIWNQRCSICNHCTIFDENDSIFRKKLWMFWVINLRSAK